MNIHERAMEVFGLKGRLNKLRTEATELANAIDRYEEGKGTLEEVCHEILDNQFIIVSLAEDTEFESIMSQEYIDDSFLKASKKLSKAIQDYTNHLYNS